MEWNEKKGARKILIMITGLSLAVLLGCLLAGCEPSGPTGGFYTTGTWDADSLGNHRIVLEVTDGADAVYAHIPWRRRDRYPENVATILVDAATGELIRNVARLEINREYGDLIFEPVTIPGRVYVYYMPWVMEGRSNYPTVTYREPQNTADPEWAASVGLVSDRSERVAERFTRARVAAIQSIDDLNSFHPMEIIATRSETDSLIREYSGEDFLLFPEDRKFPIRMSEDLPLRWVRHGVTSRFEGTADRGEFYAFQVGLFAVRKAIPDVDVSFTGLNRSGRETEIPSTSFSSFNTGGIDWAGHPMDKICTVDRGKVQALWMGVQVPEDARSGRYEGRITIAPQGSKARQIDFTLRVTGRRRKDHGDDEPWRHSRLRWLDSRIALDDSLVAPYTPVERDGRTVSCLGRNVTLKQDGLPGMIRSFFTSDVTQIRKEGAGVELLSAPVRLDVVDWTGRLRPWDAGELVFTKEAPGAVAWESVSRSRIFEMMCRAQMEFDGCIEFEVTLIPLSNESVRDIRLDIPLNRLAAKYMMGLGQKGGYRPSSFRWKWDVTKNHDAVWLGDVNAGLQASFKDINYERPLNTNFYQLKPLKMPDSWENDGRGGILVQETDRATVRLRAFSGPRRIRSGQPLHFYFRLLLTPFRPLDTDLQWSTRFYHRYVPLDTIRAKGANTVNVHHATDINPYINYPFLRPEEMKAYIDEAHRKGMKVKIYNTVRELSNRAPELFALRSLGDEIFFPGKGGGFSWLQEHIAADYIAAWFVPRLKDAAIINSGVSRWHNYYLEGLDWLVRNVGIDGLYIDDVAFDRIIMKRVRKILERGRSHPLIDLHSANQFNPRDGFANSANLYLEHFPYIDRLWFGEYFDYGSNPDFWLVEVSGIPFGLMGEMLQGGGNPWRGMIYGMTSRLPWAGDPSPLWKLWDDFGMESSRMIGYWSPDCPVRTDRPDVLATVYTRPEKTLVSIASWETEGVQCRLKVDWEALGLDPMRVRVRAPAVRDFQGEATFETGGPIPVEPGKGWLLILSEE